MSDYKRDLLKDLKSPGYAAKYLSAAYADSAEAFLVALRDVASAQKGMTKLAKTAEVNRENLYRMLSKEGNPRLDSIRAIFDALGFHVVIGSNEPSEPQPPFSRTKQSVPSARRALRGLRASKSSAAQQIFLPISFGAGTSGASFMYDATAWTGFVFGSQSGGPDIIKIEPSRLPLTTWSNARSAVTVTVT